MLKAEINFPYIPDFSFTGHHTPLRLRDAEDTPGAPGEDKSVFDTVAHYISNGFPAEKAVVTVSTYGVGFTLVDPADNGNEQILSLE